MYLVKSLSQDKGSGRYTMHLPLSPQAICRAKRVDTLCIYQTTCPERGTLPDTWALPKHTLVGSKKKPINIKHINIFLTALAGQSSRGRTPTRPRDKRDKMAILLWN